MNKLFPIALLAGLAYVFFKSSGSAADRFTLRFQASAGTGSVPAHQALYTKDGEAASQGYFQLYQQTQSGGYTPAGFLMDAQTGALVG